MKKYVVILLALFLCFMVQNVSAFDEVVLDLSLDEDEKITTETRENIKYDKIDVKDIEIEKGNINPQNIQDEMNRDLYSKKTITNKKEKQYKNMTVGVKSDTTLGAESATQTRTLYSDYKLNDKMSVGTSFKNSGNGVTSGQTKNSVSVAPEYKINKKVSIKNEYSKDFGNRTNKGELKLNVIPFEDGRMDFNAGVGEQIRDNGGASSSQVNFGTNFRF